MSYKYNYKYVRVEFLKVSEPQAQRAPEEAVPAHHAVHRHRVELTNAG